MTRLALFVALALLLAGCWEEHPGHPERTCDKLYTGDGHGKREPKAYVLVCRPAR